MFSELSLEQTRFLIDTEQAFEALQAANKELAEKFNGSMHWKTVDNKQYLYRKTFASVTKSIGIRSNETEEIKSAFENGQARLRTTISNIVYRLNELSDINKAMRLARVPLLTARIIRELANHNLFANRNLLVVGTNALFAYEAKAGVHINQQVLTTSDIDLLFDSRKSLKLLSPDLTKNGLLGLLKRVDSSFELLSANSYRAFNKTGFLVDLIQPMESSPFKHAQKSKISAAETDLTAVEIAGLSWLKNAPWTESVTIDERGFPLSLTVPDQRIFALHKFWLSKRDDREPRKRVRDREQAIVVAQLLKRTALPFETATFLPVELKALISELSALVKKNQESKLTPDW